MADRPPRIEDDDELSPLGAAPTIPADRESGRKRSASGGGPRRRLPVGAGVLALVLLVVLLALVPAVGSSLEKTPRDRVGISYGGGPIEGSHFQRIVQPGSSLFFNGFSDPFYLYPADQRSYIISKVENEGSTAAPDSVVAPSRDRVQVEYQVAMYFKLNTDRLRAFHEELGLRYSAYTDDGWDRLLQDTFRQQVENALQAETRRYDVADIFSNAELLTTIQGEVQSTVSEKLVAALGQQFFCGPTFEPGGECESITFIIKKIEIPDSVVKAFEDNRTSLVAIQTRQAEAQAIESLSAALAQAGDQYVLLRAIESGKINFWVLPSDSGVTLQAPPGTTPENQSGG